VSLSYPRFHRRHHDCDLTLPASPQHDAGKRYVSFTLHLLRLTLLCCHRPPCLSTYAARAHRGTEYLPTHTCACLPHAQHPPHAQHQMSIKCLTHAMCPTCAMYPIPTQCLTQARHAPWAQGTRPTPGPCLTDAPAACTQHN
jgi:hypothetical protein